MIDTLVTQDSSQSVRYEVVSRHGHISSIKFETAGAAAAYAKECWPDQEQDPDRAGKGWDVQVCAKNS